jgi:hypothetical protein
VIELGPDGVRWLAGEADALVTCWAITPAIAAALGPATWAALSRTTTALHAE